MHNFTRLTVLLICLLCLVFGELSAQHEGSIVGWGSIVLVEQSVLDDLVVVSAGDAFNLGLKADGSIVSWGDNSNGQCIVPLPNSDFIAVAAGSGHGLGLKSDGSVLVWGSSHQSSSGAVANWTPDPAAKFNAPIPASAHIWIASEISPMLFSQLSG